CSGSAGAFKSSAVRIGGVTVPLYEYVCPDCGESFEKRVPIAEADQTACPGCGNQHTKRRLPRIALQLQNVSRVPASDFGSTCSSGSCCGGICGLGELD
ncbi:MAG: zinc ribbon domain-containing protein, partial [Chloroflexota bacterium]